MSVASSLDISRVAIGAEAIVHENTTKTGCVEASGLQEEVDELGEQKVKDLKGNADRTPTPCWTWAGLALAGRKK